MPRETIALARVEVGGALPRSPGRREVLFNSFIALINRARGAGKPLREPGPEGGREGRESPPTSRTTPSAATPTFAKNLQTRTPKIAPRVSGAAFFFWRGEGIFDVLNEGEPTSPGCSCPARSLSGAFIGLPRC